MLLTLTLIISALPLNVKVTHAQINENANPANETFYDEDGNKIELEYLFNDTELRVNTYVNDILFEYSVTKKNGEQYSNEITNYILHDSIDDINIDSRNTTQVKTYKLNDLIVETEDEEPNGVIDTEYENDLDDEDLNYINSLKEDNNISTRVAGVTLPGTYKFIKSKYNSVLKVTGKLYGTSKTDKIQKFMFDFGKDIALSVIGSAITLVFGYVIVSIGVLLTSLGISFKNAFTSTSLNGYYNATRTRYSYYVVASNSKKSKITYRHNQEKIIVDYYNTKNGKKSTRTLTKYWESENIILNVGILNL